MKFKNIIIKNYGLFGLLLLFVCAYLLGKNFKFFNNYITTDNTKAKILGVNSDTSPPIKNEIVIKLNKESDLDKILSVLAKDGLNITDKKNTIVANSKRNFKTDSKNSLESMLVELRNSVSNTQLQNEAIPSDNIAKQIDEYSNFLTSKQVYDENNPDEFSKIKVLKISRDIDSLEFNNIKEKIETTGLVEYIAPSIYFHTTKMPNDPKYSQLYGMKKIQAENGWDVSTDSSSILVADIDTGIDYNHEDLIPNIYVNFGELTKYVTKIKDTNNNKIIDCQDLFNSSNSFIKDNLDDDNNGYPDDYCGWDFANNDNNPIDDNLHGTHTTGTIGGVGNNSKGVAGIAWKAKIMPVKFLSSSGFGTFEAAVNALKYSADMGARVSSNSWGSDVPTPIMNEIIEYSHKKGMAIVAAAGNAQSDALGFTPAYYNESITVGAVDSADKLAWFSNFGKKIDLVAPGVEILSTIPNNIYELLSGTSMATPHVSGAMALILSIRPGLDIEQARQILRITADDIGDKGQDDKFGVGRLNLKNALEYAKSDKNVLAPYIEFPKNNQDVNIQSGKKLIVKGKITGQNLKNYSILLSNMSTNGFKEVYKSTSAPENNILGEFDLGLINLGTTNNLRIIASDGTRDFSYDVSNITRTLATISINLPQYIGKGDYEVTGHTKLTPVVKVNNIALIYKRLDEERFHIDSSLTPVIDSKGVINGVIGKWNTRNLQDGEYVIGLFLETEGDPTINVYARTRISNDLMPNWPKNINSGAYNIQHLPTVSSMVDIDNDGSKDLIVNYANKIYAFDRNGVNMSGFPFQLDAAFTFLQTHNIADLDNDGQKEIVAIARKSNDPASNLYVINSRGQLLTGWPKNIVNVNYFSDNTPVLLDIDLDGKKDIVTYENMLDTNGLKISAFDIKGNRISGFLNKSSDDFGWHGALSAYDYDNDGDLELALGNGNYIYLYDNKGNVKPGFPKKALETGFFASSISFGNIRGDSTAEIIGISRAYNCISTCHGNLVTLGSDGYKSEQPFGVIFSTSTMYKAALAKFGNGFYDRTAFEPITLGSAAIDTTQHSIVKTGYRFDSLSVPVEDIGGTIKWQLPHLALYYNYLGTPVISDVDNNGTLEMAFTQKDHLYLVKLPMNSSKYDWPMYGHDELRSGNLMTQIGRTIQDTKPPIINILNPLENEEVLNSLAVNISVTDNGRVKSVNLEYGTPLAKVPLKLSNGLYTANIDISKIPRGTVIPLVVTADDLANNIASTNRNVKVRLIKPLTLNFTNPTEGMKISRRPVAVRGTWTGDYALSKITGRRCYLADGKRVSQCSPYVPIAFNKSTWSFDDEYTFINGYFRYEVIGVNIKNEQSVASVNFYFGK